MNTAWSDPLTRILLYVMCAGGYLVSQGPAVGDGTHHLCWLAERTRSWPTLAFLAALLPLVAVEAALWPVMTVWALWRDHRAAKATKQR